MRLLVLLLVVTASCHRDQDGPCCTGREFDAGPACLPDLFDIDPDAPGVQWACDYVEVSYGNDVPWCGTATDLPCWEMRETPGVCPDAEHPHFVVIVQEVGEVVPYYAYCAFEDCPDLG